ncbi:hyaluronidase B [Aplysia californica]|uniref:Hyaluronidase n=1 Tax=Aplysia californica TaxID=6500 RepID=A0ABM1W4S8_APLCA|nr:hyaluronidase B [Aplysia californica]
MLQLQVQTVGMLCLAFCFFSFFFFLGASAEGCTAPLILPDKPFFVVWNHPSFGCENHGVHLGFENWGIVDNSKDRFTGEQISIFYRLGLWPYYSGTNAVNGGIPQLTNETAHFTKVENDIKTVIPDATFSGLGVIDFEHWRPLYRLNWSKLRIYQQKSLELAKQRFPLFNSSQLLAEATKEFEEAARSIVGKTLSEVTNLRPSGRWGYYGYPRCWDEMCNTSTLKVNDEMRWIFNTSTGLYPSIYFDLSVPPETRHTRIKQKIHETLRVKAKFSPQDATVFPYALNQNGPFKFFTQADLSYSIEEPANMGSSGVVLWGSSSSMRAKNECLLLQDYVNKTLGPFVLNVTNFFGNCTQQLCQGHGRCIRKDYEKFFQHHLRASGRSTCLMNEEDLDSSSQSYGKRTALKLKNSNNSKKKADMEILNNLLQRFVDNSLKFRRRGELAFREWWYPVRLKELQDYHVQMYEQNKDLFKNQDLLQNEAIPIVDKFSISGLRNKNYAHFQTSHLSAPMSISSSSSRINFWQGEEISSDSSYGQDEGSDEDVQYDFDDYVCKCFEGWSGNHCDHKDKTS